MLVSVPVMPLASFGRACSTNCRRSSVSFGKPTRSFLIAAENRTGFEARRALRPPQGV